MIAAVTTGRKAGDHEVKRAKRLASEWRLVYIPRQGRSISRIQDDARTAGVTGDAVLVVEESELRLYQGETRFHYHPGMGLNRLRQLMRGKDDWMLRAMDIKEGDHILDATMGLASDLLVASFAAGPAGRVVGLESEKLIALVVQEGLRSYPHPRQEVVDAMRRIHVINMDYQSYLKAQENGSFDIVYFDPMFEKTVEESQQIAPLRQMGNRSPLDVGSLDEATRVARRRVVVKDRRDGPYATSSLFDDVMGGPKSRIAFCIRYVEPPQGPNAGG